MMYKKVLIKRIVSPNGRVIAEAKSVIVTSSNQPDAAHSVHQTVVVETSSQGTYSSSYTSSSSSTSDRD